MATTFVGLGITADKMLLTNVGDSRAYLIRTSRIIQLTEDHTVVNQLVKSGALTEAQATGHPVSNILSRSLGASSTLEVDIWVSEQRAQPGDTFLLCSDGLYSVISLPEIQRFIDQLPIRSAADFLIEEACRRGVKDNVTAIVVRISDSKENWHETVIHPARTRRGLRARSHARLSLRRLRRFWIPATTLLVSGLILGNLIGQIGAPVKQKAPQIPNLNTSARDARPLVTLPKSNSRVVVIPDNVNELRAFLDSNLEELESASRKVSVWHARSGRIKTEDPLLLMSEVSPFSPRVDEARTKLNEAHTAYLREAEALLYSPVDKNHKGHVSELNAATEVAKTEAAKVTSEAITMALDESLKELALVVKLRDEAERRLKQLQTNP